jgi:hypothetical protein
MTNDVAAKTHEALSAIDDLCEILQKAQMNPQSQWRHIQASHNVPDYSPEQVAAAKKPPIQAPEQVPQMPKISSEVAQNLHEYTPDRLHQIVQHASRHIADALMNSIVAHQKKPIGTPQSSPTPKASQE